MIILTVQEVLLIHWKSFIAINDPITDPVVGTVAFSRGTIQEAHGGPGEMLEPWAPDVVQSSTLFQAIGNAGTHLLGTGWREEGAQYQDQRYSRD